MHIRTATNCHRLQRIVRAPVDRLASVWGFSGIADCVLSFAS